MSVKHDSEFIARIIAIIPARENSKGIPRKNMRLMNGKPLISYAIENALKSRYITDVVVSSDSEEILAFVEQYENVMPLRREAILSDDAITLDPVVYDALIRAERIKKIRYDIVVTLQPTSPLLAVDVLDDAIECFCVSEKDSFISVVNSPHLSWVKSECGAIVPFYSKRLNRQQLPPYYLETGAFLLSKRECVTSESRLGPKVGVFEMPETQAIDIDTKQDWVVCEAMFSRKTIAFRVDGYRELGLGHVYRALTLAYELTEHEVVFLCDSNCRPGIKLLLDSNMKVVEIAGEDALMTWIKNNPVDIYVNDLLDTKRDYVRAIKKHVNRFVSFEDMGDGAREADAVVNAIYEGAFPQANVYSGKRYVCLRDEFLVAKPSEFSEKVSRILISFGGTDPLNLTERVYEIAKHINEDNICVEFDFVLGPGYSNISVIPIPEKGIYVANKITRMSDHMRLAHMAVSSQGRTTFELASLGVPTIVLAQNEREQLHTFAQMDNGFINLGQGMEVSNDDIESAICWLIGAKSVRREMRNRMLANDLRCGIRRVKNIILGELYE